MPSTAPPAIAASPASAIRRTDNPSQWTDMVAKCFLARAWSALLDLNGVKEGELWVQAGEDVVEQSPFLRLPGELRNRIYEYVLVEGVPIDVIPGKTRPPALLATCKTIRIEGIVIWVSNNFFDFPSINKNARFFARFQKHFFKYKVNKDKRNVKIEEWNGRVNWWNVVDCCEILFRAGVLSKPGLNQSAPQAKMWACALNIVYDGVKYGKTWKETYDDLCCLYDALKAAGGDYLVWGLSRWTEIVWLV